MQKARRRSAVAAKRRMEGDEGSHRGALSGEPLNHSAPLLDTAALQRAVSELSASPAASRTRGSSELAHTFEVCLAATVWPE